MAQPVRLSIEDPTVFAKCPRCCKSGRGVKQGKYYGAAFSVRKWLRGPVCDNCETPLVKLYAIQLEG